MLELDADLCSGLGVVPHPLTGTGAALALRFPGSSSARESVGAPAEPGDGFRLVTGVRGAVAPVRGLLAEGAADVPHEPTGGLGGRLAALALCCVSVLGF